ncbi:MAG TPA: LEA type 2 family protein [Puia sp.]|nr:LEA type 2 family protein [Puia sp.]
MRHTVTSSLLLFAGLSLSIAGCRQPQAPEYYGFQNLQVSQGAGHSTMLAATIKFYNPNPFSMELKRAEMDVSINGKPAGHSLIDSTILIPRKDTFYVPVSVQLDLRSILSNALQLLLDQQATLSLDGKVKVKRGMMTFNRPFHYDGKQDLKTLLPPGSGF